MLWVSSDKFMEEIRQFYFQFFEVTPSPVTVLNFEISQCKKSDIVCPLLENDVYINDHSITKYDNLLHGENDFYEKTQQA